MRMSSPNEPVIGGAAFQLPGTVPYKATEFRLTSLSLAPTMLPPRPNSAQRSTAEKRVCCLDKGGGVGGLAALSNIQTVSTHVGACVANDWVHG